MMERDRLAKLLECETDFDSYRLFVWGTGNTSDLYQEGLKRLEHEGVDIKGYFDNNPSKWGMVYNGKMVYAPESLDAQEDLFILISSPRWKTIHQIGKQLDEKGVLWMPIDAYVLKTHANQVLDAYDLLGDEKSKHVFFSLVGKRINGREIPEEYIDNDQYFYGPFLDADPSEVFVDCGAFVGDSFEQYLLKRSGVFKKAILFEPDKNNVKAIEKRLHRLKEEWNIADNKIVVCPYGIGDTNSTCYVFKNGELNGLSSKLSEDATGNTEECAIVALDSVLGDENYFIKADIESYEYKMLVGLKKTIEKQRPKIAVCVYHNSVDFYSIPLLLHELCPDYKLSLRHYTSNFSETVLYATVVDD